MEKRSLRGNYQCMDGMRSVCLHRALWTPALWDSVLYSLVSGFGTSPTCLLYLTTAETENPEAQACSVDFMPGAPGYSDLALTLKDPSTQPESVQRVSPCPGLERVSSRRKD